MAGRHRLSETHSTPDRCVLFNTHSHIQPLTENLRIKLFKPGKATTAHGGEQAATSESLVEKEVGDLYKLLL